MQQTTFPPGTPQAPQAPQPFVVDAAAIPRTGREVEAVRIRIDDLKNELQNAAERRNSVMSRMREAPNAALPGLEARLAELDNRILNVEREITRNTMLLEAAPTEALLAGTTQAPDPNIVLNRIADDIVPIVAILALFVFAPFGMALSRLIWKRASNAPVKAAASDHATQQKLEQLQQAVDAVAIEVERISEGQRFVTRLLNERAVAAGGAEPLPIGRKAGVAAERP